MSKVKLEIKISKDYILNEVKKTITSSNCWIRDDIKTIPKVNGHPLHRVVAHLWHGLNLYDTTQEACHRCNNGLCFNPDHIYNGNHSSNMLDAVEAGTHISTRKITCRLGHPLDGLKIRSSGENERYCKTCQKMANIRFRSKGNK